MNIQEMVNLEKEKMTKEDILNLRGVTDLVNITSFHSISNELQKQIDQGNLVMLIHPQTRKKTIVTKIKNNMITTWEGVYDSFFDYEECTVTIFTPVKQGT